MITSLTSCIISGVNRCRNRDIMLGSNGAVCLYSVSPMKYCRYGFIAMCATVISSENRYRSLMSCDPSAIRRLHPGCPVFDLNCSAYFFSNTHQGMIFASFTHSFSGSSGIPPNIAGLSNILTWFSFRLYILTSRCKVFPGPLSFPLHLLYHISGWMHCYFGVLWLGRKHYVATD